MAFRRDPHDDRLFEYRSRSRGPEEPEVQRSRSSRAPRGLGSESVAGVKEVQNQLRLQPVAGEF